jgi:YHS domain-containing protein
MGSFLFEILDFVILVLFVMGLVRKLGYLFQSPRVHMRTSGAAPRPSPSAAPHRGEMVRDPVCGMFVSTELSHQLKRGKDTLHFCSRECMEKFQKGAEHVAS